MYPSSRARLQGLPLNLLTDLYQLTMAYGYWKNKMAEREAVFHLFFRENPFKGEFAVVCGLDLVIDFLQHFRFTEEDIRYLSHLKAANGDAMFEPEFLNYLKTMEFSCDIVAIPEGTIAFAHQPLIRVKGPLLQAQLIETALLNMINFSSLIATKAARIVNAAAGEEVVEFGLRRAQGFDGAMSASRAAYIGGCSATSNLLASQRFGIPVRGTHAHSWVMCFDSELEAFTAYARAMPNNCIFLVDTYDTIQGIKNAIQVGHELRQWGYDLLGIRLDSGDLAELSDQARQLLNKAGFKKTKIIASGDLDEHSIRDLKRRTNSIDMWGVGTRLVTGFDQPALGGVYKLTAIRDQYGNWQNRLKLSDEQIKISIPGIQQVWRLYRGKVPVGDIIVDEQVLPEISKGVKAITIRDLAAVQFDQVRVEKLMTPVFRNGKLVYSQSSIQHIRQYFLQQRNLFSSVNLREYPVGLEEKLYQEKKKLVEERFVEH